MTAGFAQKFAGPNGQNFKCTSLLGQGTEQSNKKQIPQSR